MGLKLRSELLFGLTVVFLIVVTLRNFLAPGYPPSWGGDSYGHLFKIWKLMHGYKPWIEDWYSGYPFLWFYPPLAYYIAAFLGKLSGSAIDGYKLTVIISMVTGAYAMRFLLREFGFRNAVSYVAAIAYVLAPYHLRILSPEGNFPRFVGINLAPFFILATVYVFRGNTRKAPLAGLFMAIVLLVHHTLFATFGLLALFMLPYLLKERGQLKDILKSGAVASAFAFLLSAFWVVPFALNKKYAYFLKENHILYLFKFQSAHLIDILTPTGPWSFYQGILMYLGVLGALIILFFKRIKERKLLSIAVLSGIFVPIFLALGYYGPAPWINQLPFFDLIPPYRWLDAVEFASAIGFALLLEFLIEHTEKIENRNARKITVGLILLLLLFSLSDVRYREPMLHAEKFPEGYIKVLERIGNDSSIGWRYSQWGLGITQGSRVAFTPALSGKPTIDGWYRQGDPNYPYHSYLNYAIANDPHFAKKALSLYSVKYVILDSNFRDYAKGLKTLRKIGFHEVYSAGNFKLYSWNNWSFVRAASNVLIVGNWPLNIPASTQGEQLDDYTRVLGEYSLVILNGYNYSNPIVWKYLGEYVRNGGTLIVNTFRSPDQEGTIFGVRSVVVRVFGRANLTSRVYNVSKFSNFSYEGKPWTATVYEGNLTPLLKMGKYTVIGIEHIGRGRIIFIGLNLPYHAVYSDNTYEKKILEDLVAPYIRIPSLQYKVLKIEDGLIEVEYNLNSSSNLLVSENYYPYWRAYIDGKRIPVEKGELGVILIHAPAGRHFLVLKFDYPYTPLRILSGATLITLLFLMGIENRVRKRGSNDGDITT